MNAKKSIKNCRSFLSKFLSFYLVVELFLNPFQDRAHFWKLELDYIKKQVSLKSALHHEEMHPS